ncbi:Phage tail protein [Micromonospora sediminicola]|uniref:Phage tail protein n=1 Tax=Micromonospora sediminicola TaxID=946078 RepID=A0A1A9B5A6_9ACTN|nr:phage tail domain-containing protein [Micromonospora sediminicola]SBT64214.1 Phage tail protein [Micromonospora sediminicola]
MPVYVGTISTPPPPVDTPSPIPTPAPPPVDPGRPVAVWIAPDGTEWPLTNDSTLFFTLNAVTGWGAAPINIVADDHPRGGTRVRHIQPQPRTITWPLRVRADTHLELVAGWRALSNAFTQTRRLGPGRLRIMRPNGDAREILAYYQQGFDGEPGQGHTYDTAVLSLYCEDPFWRAVRPLSLPYAYGTAVSYLSPYLTVSPSSVLGTATAVNEGNVEAWPTWTIVGPATAVVATNLSTGEAFTLTGTLTAGQVATITTDPPAVRGPGGANWTGKLTWPGAQLWALQPGLNNVEFAVAGAAAGTAITLSYVPRYETA